VTGEDLVPGVISAIQTFGDRLNFHPNFHFLVTEGGMDTSGDFQAIPRIGDARLAEPERKFLSPCTEFPSPS
jgi:hypothetical protein